VRPALAVAILLSVFALLPLKAALAQEACVEPQPPAPVDGAQLNEDQMRAANDAARNFMAQSDVFRACLANAVDAAKTQAAADGKPLDPAVENDAKAKADANQKLKERVGAEIGTAISVYKQSHLK
jgi:hypothetical protein